MRPLILALVLVGCPAPGDDHADTDTDSDTPTDTDAAAGPTADAGPDLEVAVGEPLTITGTVTGGEARWDLGDGTIVDGAEVTHTWTEPGNLVVTLQVTSPGGRRATDSLRLSVYRPAPPSSLRPTSGPLAVDQDGRIWVPVPEADALAIVPADGSAPTHLPIDCDEPRAVTIGPGHAVVACTQSDELLRVRLDTLAEDGVRSFTPGARPVDVQWNGTSFATAQSGWGDLVLLDFSGGPVDARNADDVHALAVGPRGTVWATRFRGRLTDPLTGAGEGVVYTGDTEVILGEDPGPDSDTSQRGVPNLLGAITISPDGGTVYVGGQLSNTRAGDFRDDIPLEHDTTIHATLRVIDADTKQERPLERRQFDNQDSVSALALTPRGSWLFAAHLGTHTISRVDAYTLATTGAILDAGRGITGLAVSDDGSTLYVHAWLDRELRAYDISDPSDPDAELLWTVPTVSAEPLTAEVLRGKQLFHDSRDTRLAKDGYQHCAGCHPGGDQDGMVWDFTQRGEGLRNTISLLGRAGTGMGPVHWSGNFDEIQDFENDIRFHQGGAGLMDDADFDDTVDTLGTPKAGLSDDLDALAAYVTSLDATPLSPSDAEPTHEAEFTAAGCGACHDPATGYTDSALGVRHDVGTISAASGSRLGGPLDGIDTPTLLGVQSTGPWLHDGSAATIADAIRAHDGPDFDVDHLSASQISAIDRFVGSL